MYTFQTTEGIARPFFCPCGEFHKMLKRNFLRGKIKLYIGCPYGSIPEQQHKTLSDVIYREVLHIEDAIVGNA